MLWARHPLKQVLPTYYLLRVLVATVHMLLQRSFCLWVCHPKLSTNSRWSSRWLVASGFSSPLHVIRLKCWSQFPYLWNVLDIAICIYVCLYIHIHMSPIRIDPKLATMNDIAVSILFSTPYNFPPMSPTICVYIYIYICIDDISPK